MGVDSIEWQVMTTLQLIDYIREYLRAMHRSECTLAAFHVNMESISHVFGLIRLWMDIKDDQTFRSRQIHGLCCKTGKVIPWIKSYKHRKKKKCFENMYNMTEGWREGEIPRTYPFFHSTRLYLSLLWIINYAFCIKFVMFTLNALFSRSWPSHPFFVQLEKNMNLTAQSQSLSGKLN